MRAASDALTQARKDSIALSEAGFIVEGQFRTAAVVAGLLEMGIDPFKGRMPAQDEVAKLAVSCAHGLRDLSERRAQAKADAEARQAELVAQRLAATELDWL